MTNNYATHISFAALLALLVVACSGDTENKSEAAPAAASEEAPEVAGMLCVLHGASASQCFICDASLRQPNRLWCHEHARYEDRCFECHPEIRDKDRLYCEEHGLYEDECFICHPEVRIEESSTGSPETGGGLASADSDALYCREHDVREIECGICQPTLADGLQPGQGLKIRLPSVTSESKAHIVAAYPQTGPAGSSVHAVGELGFNQNRLVHITPLADGVVRRVHVDVGKAVKRGDVLAELSSPKVAEAKAVLLRAVAEETVSSQALSRQQELFEKELSSAQDLYDAEARHMTARASLRAAEQMLLDLGFNQKSLERIVSQQEASSVALLVAPFAGTVITRHAVVGDLAAVGDQVFSIVDLSTLWLSLAVSERDVVKLRVGHSVEVRSQALDREIHGQITWISSQLNETTRMAEVRAEVANVDGLLRAGMFVNSLIAVEESSPSLLLPRDAIHRFGGKPFVFVRIASDLYELRRVETSQSSQNLTAVTAGLADRDPVAVEQSYLLKSEFQKSRLGAGCVD